MIDLTLTTGVSGVCHMQDMQVARHTPYKGKPYLFHGLRVLWLSAIGERRKNWFPGPSWQAQQKQNRLGVNTYCNDEGKVFSARLSHVVHFFSHS